MDANQTIKVIELRNYLVKRGMRDRFIDYFQKHFVESQNAAGGYVLGGFRIENAPDRFFWIRGFSAMNSRSRFLPEFYGGVIWKKFGPKANEMMLEWHNVHLLKPLEAIKIKDFTTTKIAAIDFYFARNGKSSELVNSLQTANQFSGATFWISEMTENDFPRLPVIQNENLLAAMTDREAERQSKNSINGFGNLVEKHERLILSKAF